MCCFCLWLCVLSFYTSSTQQFVVGLNQGLRLQFEVLLMSWMFSQNCGDSFTKRQSTTELNWATIVVKNYDNVYFLLGECEVLGHSLEVTATISARSSCRFRKNEAAAWSYVITIARVKKKKYWSCGGMLHHPLKLSSVTGWVLQRHESQQRCQSPPCPTFFHTSISSTT